MEEKVSKLVTRTQHVTSVNYFLGGLRTTDSMTLVEKSCTALPQQNMMKLLCNYISYPYTAVASSNTKEIKLCYMMALFTAIPETRSVRNKRSGNRVPHWNTFRKLC